MNLLVDIDKMREKSTCDLILGWYNKKMAIKWKLLDECILYLCPS